jgi:hypothetical protein
LKDLDKATTDARIARENYIAAGSPDTVEIPTPGAGIGQVGATVTAVSEERSALNAANQAWAERKQALNEAEKAHNDLLQHIKNTGINFGDLDSGGGSGTGGGGEDPITTMEKQAEARLNLARFIADEELELYTNSFQKKAAAEQLSYERTKADLEQQGRDKLLTEEEVNAGIEALEAAHQARMVQIAKDGAESAAKATKEARDNQMKGVNLYWKRVFRWMEEEGRQSEKLKEQKVNAALDYLDVASRVISSLSAMTHNSMNRELADAGENKARREAIEKKYFEKQKQWSIVMATINTAVAVTKALPNYALAALTGIAGGIEIAAISAQEFADGGIAYGPTLGLVGEYPGARSNPEVIAPLSKLQEIMNPVSTGQPRTIMLRAEGRDLVATIDAEMMNQLIH